MTTRIPPVSTSPALPPSVSPSRWGIHSVILLAGAGVLVYILWRLYSNNALTQTPPPKQQLPDLSKRFLTTLFPQDPIVGSSYLQHAAGIVRIPADKLQHLMTELRIACQYEGQICSDQPMTFNSRDNCWEGLLPDMPYNETVRLIIGGTVLQETGFRVIQEARLKVEHPMGIYELGGDSHLQEGSFKLISSSDEPRGIEAMVGIKLEDTGVTLSKIYTFAHPDAYLQIHNLSSRIHLVFFTIRNTFSNETIRVPVVMFQGHKNLSRDFLQTSWRRAYAVIHPSSDSPHSSSLELAAIDVAAST